MNQASQQELERFNRRLGLIVLLAVLMLVPLALLLVWRLRTIEDALHFREPGMRDEARREVDTLPWRPIQGQTLYVPAYSHIYQQGGKPRLLTVMLSARNTDREHEIALTAVQYFDTSGKLVRTLIDKPLRLGPLASTEFLIEQDDASGGSGASFLLQWQSGEAVTEPLVESIMIDTSHTQGISFIGAARVLDEIDPGGSAPADASATETAEAP